MGVHHVTKKELQRNYDYEMQQAYTKNEVHCDKCLYECTRKTANKCPSCATQRNRERRSNNVQCHWKQRKIKKNIKTRKTITT